MNTGTNLMHALIIVSLCIAFALLTGCAGARLENRLACTINADQMAVISWWGPLGVASKIAKADAQHCPGAR